uniref:Uncharacterized protein n=1 Tax=Rhizophora mucronata TaxID=61149 RepID=A0A2P2QFH4_RHIMU
MWIACGYNYR